MPTAAHLHVSSLPLALLLLALLSTDAVAEDATSRQQQASHLVAEAATPADFEAMIRVEFEARAINERLMFQLMNLTGSTFRMWFCGYEPVQDKGILAGLLEKAALSESERQVFLRWYTLKFRLPDLGGNELGTFTPARRSSLRRFLDDRRLGGSSRPRGR